jgi:hypothetical protein
MVRSSFRKNANLTDDTVIEARKGDAVRAMSNYLLTTNISRDRTIAVAAREYHERTLHEISKSFKHD